MRNTELGGIANEVLDWAVERGFRGTDPYDGLNSIPLTPLLERSRLLRLLVIQAVKRSALNIRPLLGVPEGYNPKGLALFLSGMGFSGSGGKSPLPQRLVQMILSLASDPRGKPVFSTDRRMRDDITVDEACDAGTFAWGYNFPWQSRAFLQPAWYPTTVCSSFVLDSLRDSGSPFFPVAARSLARFVLLDLNIHREGEGICFSYSPLDRTRVYNASLLAARILVRAAEVADGRHEREMLGSLAGEACSFVAGRQRKDGSWFYGEADHWRWVDNLHTGFVLEAMFDISLALNTDAWDESIQRGLEYYEKNLFTQDGTAKYYADRLYPLDPHCFAQGSVTFEKLGRHDLADAVLRRSRDLLWNARKHGFVVRRNRFFRDMQVHMRWNQGWMFKALRFVLSNRGEPCEDMV